MKIIALFLSLMAVSASGQTTEGDRILGLWQTGSGKGRIQIYKYGEKYGGKLVWLREPNDASGKPKLDDKNPDVNKRRNPKLGLNNLLGFHYDGDGEYEDGTIYDPENGKTYKCIMELESPDVLKVRGYIGFSLIGRTDTWTRVKE
jgi:uncharacterized protein (DUF2147 family)